MTPDQADSEIKDLIRDAWLASLVTVNIPLLYSGVRAENPAGVDANGDSPDYGRVTVLHADGENAAIGGTLADAFGTVIVQVFAPAGYGSTRALQLANIARTALQGAETPGGAWFKDVGVRTVGESGNWYQVNVVASFEYRST